MTPQRVYATHRCQESLKAKASIRKLIIGYRYDSRILNKWFLGKAEIDGEWGSTYLHTLYVEMHYCPFCGIRLESEE